MDHAPSDVARGIQDGKTVNSQIRKYLADPSMATEQVRQCMCTDGVMVLPAFIFPSCIGVVISMHEILQAV